MLKEQPGRNNRIPKVEYTDDGHPYGAQSELDVFPLLFSEAYGVVLKTSTDGVPVNITHTERDAHRYAQEYDGVVVKITQTPLRRKVLD